MVYLLSTLFPSRKQDWHPPNHISFASNTPNGKVFETKTMEYEGETFPQQLWPDHCVVSIDRQLRLKPRKASL